jgi:hypothetical protein
MNYNNIALILLIIISNLVSAFTEELQKIEIPSFNDELNSEKIINKNDKFNENINSNISPNDFNKLLIGTWQREDSLLSDGLQDVFRFYKNNKFRFNISQYKWDNPVKLIMGDFKINNTEIILKIKELTYYDLSEIYIADLLEESATPWIFPSHDKYKHKLKLRKKFILTIKINKNYLSDYYTLELNNFTYYKLNDDPDYLNY